MKRKTEIIILILIICLGFLLRIYNIDKESYWIDEAFTIHDISKNNVYDVAKDLISNDAIPPFYIVLIYFWKSFFGISEFAIRSFSALFGTLSIIVAYLLFREFSKGKISLFATLLFSISVPEILFSQEARAYALVTFLALLSTYFLVLSIKRNKICLISYILFSTLMVYTLYFCFFLLIFQFLFVYFFRPDKIRLSLIGIVSIILAFMPWIPLLIKQFNINKGLINFLRLPSFLASLGLFIFLIPFFFVLIMLFIILKIEKNKDLVHRLTKNDTSNILLLSCFLILYFSVSLILLKGTFLIRHLLFLSPFFYFVVSFQTFSIKNKPLKISIVILILILFLIPTILFYETNRKADWKEAINFIESNELENEIIAMEDGHSIYAFEIYYHGKSELFPIIAEHPPADSEFLSRIEDKNGIWLVLSRNWFSKDYYKYRIQEVYGNPIIQQEFKDIAVYFFKGKPKIK